MSDSKSNKPFHDAVRKGRRGAARRIGSTWKNMRVWQKTGLILCLVFWVASVILGAVCRRVTGSLIDQTAAGRWSKESNYAQISCFMAEGSGASEETVSAMYSGLMLDLQESAIGLSDTQIENGASLVEQCYCGMGSADISSDTDTVTVNAIGVGGDFFNFHPLDLLDGYYFADDDLMQDRVLLDDQTAWRLFGSPNVVGMSVSVGGTPHVIAGVFRQPRERFYKDSGMGSFLVFMSYDSLCKYTDSGVSDEGSSSDDGSMDMDMTEGMDAFVPAQHKGAGLQAAADLRLSETGRTEDSVLSSREGPDASSEAVEPAVPRTAAYMPQSSQDYPGKKAAGTLTETIEADDSDSDSGGSEEVPEEDSEPLSDEPVGENFESDDGYGGGSTAAQYDDGDGEDTEAPVINRSRVCCYEVVMPNPVPGFALSKVRSRLEQISFSMDNVNVVDNSSRYDILRLVSLLGQPGVRSMQVAPIRYPYWENVALGWEDILIPFALLWMVLRYSPVLFLFLLLVWYATHKSWTVGGIVKNIQDKIYERQSERIYGKGGTAALPVNSAQADALPDQSSSEEGADALPDHSSSEEGADALPDHSSSEEGTEGLSAEQASEE